MIFQLFDFTQLMLGQALANLMLYCLSDDFTKTTYKSCTNEYVVVDTRLVWFFAKLTLNENSQKNLID